MDWRKELARYETYLKGKGVTAEYLRTLESYLTRLGERFKPTSFLDLDQEAFSTWFAELREKGLREASIATMASHVKATLRWLNDGETPRSLKGLVIGRSKPRVKSKTELLTDRDLERLLKALGPQKRAIVRLLRATGARPSEVLGLRREDVDLRQHDGNGEYVELTFRHTKNGQVRSVPIVDPVAVQELKDYLEIGPQAGLLFPSPMRKGKPLLYQTLSKAMKTAARRVGLTKRIYPYLLRHTRATELHASPAGVRDRLMGWKSPLQWRNYEHLETDDLRDFLFEREGPGPEAVPLGVNAEWAEDVSSTIRQFAALIQRLDNGQLSKEQRKTVDTIRQSFE